MEQEKPLFNVLWSSKVWDDDRRGVAEYGSEKVYFLFINEYLNIDEPYPDETRPIIDQHKLDAKKMGNESEEYWKKYPQYPWIGFTENYDICYDSDGAGYGYYQIREGLYHFYRMPIETIIKLDDYFSGRCRIDQKELTEIFTVENYECLGKFKPSQLKN